MRLLIEFKLKAVTGTRLLFMTLILAWTITSMKTKNGLLGVDANTGCHNID